MPNNTNDTTTKHTLPLHTGLEDGGVALVDVRRPGALLAERVRECRPSVVWAIEERQRGSGIKG